MAKKKGEASRTNKKAARKAGGAERVWLAGLGALATDRADTLAARGEAAVAGALDKADAANAADLAALRASVRRLAAALGDADEATAQFRVEQVAGGWRITRDGQEVAVAPIRKGALAIARRLAKGAAPSHLIVVGTDGGAPTESVRYA